MPSVPPLRGSFRTDIRARAAYSEGAGVYRVVPAAVALPVDEPDLRALLQWAVGSRQSAERWQSLTLRGAGSAMGGGNVGEGIVVDLTAMAERECAVDAIERTVITSARVTLGEIERAAEPFGLRLPPDPSSARWATAGGAFSTNASGPRTLRYGSMRRWALGATVMMADGERMLLRRGEAVTGRAAARFESEVAPAIREMAPLIRQRFPHTRKNSSGYALDAWLESGDLLDLFIGAEGTLGVVTEVTWRLDPIPPFRSGLKVEIADVQRIAGVIAALTATGPSMCELLDRSFLDVVRSGAVGAVVSVPDADAVLLLEYEEDSAATLESAVSRGVSAARSAGARAVRPRDAEEEAAIWTLRHAASPILARLPLTQRSMQVVEDGCVPVNGLAEYLQLLRDAAAARDLPVVLFGHAGDGHVHANLLPDTTRPGWSDAVASMLEEVSAGVIALGGTPSGEHGDGRLRAGLMERLYGPEIMGLFRMVKNCFDPLGILNPGVILPAVPDEAPLSRLKVGADAAPIPDDIADGLRRIEREGGYATPRLELL